MIRQQTVRKVFVKLELLPFSFSRRYPLSYVYSGSFEWTDGTLYVQGLGSYWWSSTSSSSIAAYFLIHGSNDLNPAIARNKALGFTLRRRRVNPTALLLLSWGRRLLLYTYKLYA
ncbi:hypothetical protein IJH16_02825 [Candidatus Saccharibacteria bacterium]|nr:hypothetical protein [Candidatus Saccharibacteria bacterium]